MQDGASAQIALDMVTVPEGTFLMGTKYTAEDTAEGEETPSHQVWLSAYQIQRTPVTVGQWQTFVSRTGYEWSMKTWLDAVREFLAEEPTESYPITNVSWLDCSAFIEWLRQVNGANFALPTEAQWEKACRGSDGQLYPWTKSEPNFDKEMVEFNHRLTLRPVAFRLDRASPFGCLDMCDNIYEWCADWYDDLAYEKHMAAGVPRDPRGAEEHSVLRLHSVRGGPGFNYHWPRCSYRGSAGPHERKPWIGFRVALSE
jgi:sulfatase modifying factor 1